MGSTLLLIQRGYNYPLYLWVIKTFFWRRCRGVIAWGEYSRVCLFAILSCSLSLVMDMEHEIPKKLGVLATHGDGEPPKTLDAHYVQDIMY